MAVRQAVRRQHRARRETPLNDGEMLEQAAVAGSPESEYVKRAYGQEFKAAFEGALRDLPDRERLVLRQHYVDALTIDELAALYRATADRAVTAGLAYVECAIRIDPRLTRALQLRDALTRHERFSDSD